jgi:hypothetical protein
MGLVVKAAMIATSIPILIAASPKLSQVFGAHALVPEIELGIHEKREAYVGRGPLNVI